MTIIIKEIEIYLIPVSYEGKCRHTNKELIKLIKRISIDKIKTTDINDYNEKQQLNFKHC